MQAPRHRHSIIAGFILLLIVAGAPLHAQNNNPEGGESKASEPPAPPSPEQLAKNKQVMLQSYILEWTTDRSFDFGFAIDYTKTVLENNLELTDASMVLPPPSVPEIGIRAFFDNFELEDDIEIVAEALEQVGKVKKIHEITQTCKVSPDGKTPASSIHSGGEIPYDDIQPSGSDNFYASLRYTKVGTQVDITEVTIPVDGYVQFHIGAEVSDVVNTVPVGKDTNGESMFASTESNQKIDGTLLVKNGNLIVYGIIKTNTKNIGELGVPWLSRIPILGYLFKSHSVDKSSRELLFLIRPIIIDMKDHDPTTTT